MEAPLISVIVPVHNAKAYIEDCIASVYAQSYRNWQLVLVDDASTDGSDDICRRACLANLEQVLFVRAGGKGVSAARNIGTRQAGGEFISYLDADDKLLPTALERMASIALDYPACRTVVAQFSRKKTCVRHLHADVKVYSADEAIVKTLYQEPDFHPSAWAKLYRRDVVADAFAEGRRYEDLEAFARIYEASGMIAVTTEKLYYYRPNPSSFINTWSESRLDALWAVDRLREFAQGKKYMEKAALARSFSAYFNIFELAVRSGEHDIARRCARFICQHRKEILRDSRVRLKNKAGALLSYAGQSIMALAARIHG